MKKFRLELPEKQPPLTGKQRVIVLCLVLWGIVLLGILTTVTGNLESWLYQAATIVAGAIAAYLEPNRRLSTWYGALLLGQLLYGIGWVLGDIDRASTYFLVGLLVLAMYSLPVYVGGIVGKMVRVSRRSYRD